MRNIAHFAATLLLLTLPATALGQALPFKDGRPVAGPDPMILGTYDPHGDFTNDPTPKVEHLFLPWLDIDLSTLPLADNYARERGRDLWITVEPWTWDQSRRITPEELRQGMFTASMTGSSTACAARSAG